MWNQDHLDTNNKHINQLSYTIVLALTIYIYIYQLYVLISHVTPTTITLNPTTMTGHNTQGYR